MGPAQMVPDVSLAVRRSSSYSVFALLPLLVTAVPLPFWGNGLLRRSLASERPTSTSFVKWPSLSRRS
jgi:hypothetical protein